MSILWVILLTFIPTFELRASIPAGVLGIPVKGVQLEPLSPWLVIPLAILTNILLGILLYEVLDILIRLLEKNPRIHAVYKAYEKRLLEKTARWERVEWILLAFFIGIPLPGSGVYSGSILARALLLKRRDAYKAIILGVLIAGSIVSILTLTGKALLT